jgi:DNA invertase Pin-like site-specific DNA recombinase
MTSTDARPRVVIYCRLSKDREGAGVNTDEQERLCREYAAQRGYDVADVFTDDDLTAYTKSSRYKGRPGYDRMLEGLRARRYDAVIAWHTDRLHRSNTELDDYIDATGGLDGDYIPTWTVKGTPIDLSTASGRMVAHILAAVAKQEVEHATERIRASKERNRVNGLRTSGTAPFGYRTDDRDYDGKQIPGRSRGLVIIPEEAAAVRKAYADFLSGITLAAIAREWRAAGYASHRKGLADWEPYMIRRTLLRAANAGLIEHPVIPYGKGKIIGRAAWEPIIDEETFYAARATLMDPSRSTNYGRGGGRTPEHLLSGTGILICSVCDSQAFAVKTVRRIHELSGEDDPKRYKYLRYQCRENWSHPGRNKRHLEAWVQAVVIERLAEPDTIEAHRPQEIDITPLIARRKGLQHRLDELARLLESGDMDPEVAAKASKGLRAQLERADQALADAYTVTQRHLREFEECDGREAVARVWEGLDLLRKREIISMFYRFRIHPTKKGRRPANDPLDISTIEIIDA